MHLWKPESRKRRFCSALFRPSSFCSNAAERHSHKRRSVLGRLSPIEDALHDDRMAEGGITSQEV